jgi:hypothetical protein
VVNPADLSRAFTDLLENESERHALGRRASEIMQSQRGATQFTMDQLRGLLKSGVREVHPA